MQSEFEQPKSNPSNVLGIIITVIITAVVVGGAVYYWQDSEDSDGVKYLITNKKVNSVSLDEPIDTDYTSCAIDGDLYLILYDKPDNKVQLEVRTVNKLADTSYYLGGSSELYGDSIKTSIVNVRRNDFTVVNAPVATPASYRTAEVELDNGTYTISLYTGDLIDKYELTIDSSGNSLEVIDASFSSVGTEDIDMSGEMAECELE